MGHGDHWELAMLTPKMVDHPIEGLISHTALWLSQQRRSRLVIDVQQGTHSSRSSCHSPAPGVDGLSPRRIKLPMTIHRRFENPIATVEKCDHSRNHSILMKNIPHLGSKKIFTMSLATLYNHGYIPGNYPPAAHPTLPDGLIPCKEGTTA